MMEEKTKCKEGWTQWISESIPENLKDAKSSDFKSLSSKPYSIEKENLPSLFKMVCMFRI